MGAARLSTKLNCHLLNCNVQIMIFCWLILILIQLPQNRRADEREEKVNAWYFLNISNSSRESVLFIHYFAAGDSFSAT